MKGLVWTCLRQAAGPASTAGSACGPLHAAPAGRIASFSKAGLPCSRREVPQATALTAGARAGRQSSTPRWSPGGSGWGRGRGLQHACSGAWTRFRRAQRSPCLVAPGLHQTMCPSAHGVALLLAAAEQPVPIPPGPTSHHRRVVDEQRKHLLPPLAGEVAAVDLATEVTKKKSCLGIEQLLPPLAGEVAAVDLPLESQKRSIV